MYFSFYLLVFHKKFHHIESMSLGNNITFLATKTFQQSHNDIITAHKNEITVLGNDVGH